ncbi:PRC-barrel domain-containing protein [Chelativorans salis]|uniref:PRC-barrel domain-containing protein n=1 Tax=Chelativorans salis TaxID=2978478 RepID=A0ABT2LJJ0_9HYPH|nr:PRC-barrel domain-containing protein [Chelativorans sp. EGI FJ00035]MCT7374204.1 PRC-barrel domain-containing protein [Chelativorans sp. EGI FJ00035]
MLWNASNVMDCRIEATDGSIGSVDDFLFDDESWTTRWLVVDTGTLFAGRRVLLPPSAVQSADPQQRTLSVSVTRQQVKDSPEIDTDAPVSRQQESSLYEHYGWAPYWGPYFYAPATGVAAPVVPPRAEPDRAASLQDRTERDPHLRSMNAVTGYYVDAEDGDIGHVEDFLLDSDGWAIRYVVVDTKNWWPGKKVLVPPVAFTDVNWGSETVRVELTRDQVRNGPEYDPKQTVERAFEERYHDYYGYPYYWR